MRILLLAGWVLLVPAAYAYHMGGGKAQASLDATADKLKTAESLAKAEDFAAAIAAYDDALNALPKDRTAESRQIRVERAKAMMLAKKLPEAHSDLNALADELANDPTADPKLVAAAQETQANAQYYMTWLMRLEGRSRDEWEPEIEASRQTYKLLAEKATDAATAVKHKEDLEAAIRLARMELSELQGLALPKKCNGCCSCNSKCKSGKKPAEKKPEKQDIRSAGSGAVPETGGR